MMSTFEPFKLEEPDYNTINIKKVFDIFPTSLRIKQLTSEQLLEFLESQIVDRDEQIEELLARLRDLLNEGTALGDVSGLLTNFTGNLNSNLNSLINDTLDTVTSNASDAQLEGQGYDKVGNNLFIKVEKRTITDENARRFFDIDFAHNEFKLNSSITYNPTSVKFRNTSESDTIIVQKLEKYEKALNQYGQRVQTYEGYARPFIYTNSAPSISNTFKLVDLQNQTQISIPPNTEFVSSVKGETNASLISQFGLLKDFNGTNIQHIGKMVFQNKSDGSEFEYSMQFDRDND